MTSDANAIRFAERLLALLDQGAFTATYKFAVLLGLMDLCLEHCDKFGEPPPMATTSQLAGKVIELYWPQTTPFDDAEPLLLRQNTGRTAVILNRILDFRKHSAPDPGCSLHRARLHDRDRFADLINEVEWTLVLMPLPKLQRFGGADEPFIYRIAWDDTITKAQWRDTHSFDNRIMFVGSAASHLVRLTPLLRPLIQQKWVEMVGRINDLEVARLERFLFGADRISLQPVRDHLRELQRGTCFYCGGPLRSTPEVDHFMPWSRHPDDTLDNLVLAHRSCNNQKRDFLVSSEHLAHWAARLANHDGELHQIAEEIQWPRSTIRTLGIVRGTFLSLPDGVALWHIGRDFLPSHHRDLVEALGPVA